MSYLEELFSLQGKTAVVIGGTGELCGAMATALAGAFAVLDGWEWDGGRFSGWVYRGVEPNGTPSQLVEGDGAANGRGTGIETWMGLGPACVLRHDPTHPKALPIMRQLIAEANQEGKWIPPDSIRIAVGGAL